ncbi:hypothetical protein HPB47_005669 [Ixodes persulcatus]|uniref:Uncharacterized protein n=1 Tax=Ixodes persulcatus TaxID=34615 RepID=A0AC60PCA9_IXOPE|nr:hypothetical protein HPB47_005669 [Ixodes persulcatus]
MTVKCTDFGRKENKDKFFIYTVVSGVKGNLSHFVKVTFKKWDSYHTAMTRLAGVPFAERIQHALREARTEYNVKEDTQQPDLHLVNLWDRQLEALTRYRTKRSLQNKIYLNDATAEA